MSAPPPMTVACASSGLSCARESNPLAMSLLQPLAQCPDASRSIWISDSAEEIASSEPQNSQLTKLKLLLSFLPHETRDHFLVALLCRCARGNKSSQWQDRSEPRAR